MKNKIFSEKIAGYMIKAMCIVILYLILQNNFNDKNMKPEMEIKSDSIEYDLIMADFRQKDSINMVENPVVERKIITMKKGDNLCRTLSINYYEAMSFVNRTHFEIEYDSVHNRQIPIIPIGTQFVIAKRKNGEKIVYENTPDVYCLMTVDDLDK